MLMLRVARGVTQHFNVRASEWLMAYTLLVTWAALTVQPDAFEGRASFEYLNYYATAQTWAVICAGCGVLRLTALVVNGTWKQKFPYSPHLRVFASFVSIAFWSQFSLGFANSALFTDGLILWVAFTSSFVLAECINVYRSWTDVGESIKARQTV